MLGIGVDRIAEQQQLDDRDANDHRVGEAGADELGELLREDRHDARERQAHHAACRAFWPAAPRIRWMNTSSRLGGTSLQRHGSLRKGSIAASSLARLVPLTWSAAPKGATMSTPGLPVRSRARRSARSPSASNVTRCDWPTPWSAV